MRSRGSGGLVLFTVGAHNPLPAIAARGADVPGGVLVFVAIQWYAFVRNLAGRPSIWTGRHYRREPSFESTKWESTIP